MLDTALLEALSHATRPVPAIMRPVQTIGGDVSHLVRDTAPQLEQGEAELAEWIEHGRIARETITAALTHAQEIGYPAEDAVRVLDQAIAGAEAASRLLGQAYDEQEQRFRAQVRLAQKISAAAGGTVEKISARAMSLLAREMEERGDFALFLRAWKAQLSEGGSGGPSFDDADALDAYLRAATAA
jgi:hypothetical protein